MVHISNKAVTKELAVLLESISISFLAGQTDYMQVIIATYKLIPKNPVL